METDVTVANSDENKDDNDDDTTPSTASFSFSQDKPHHGFCYYCKTHHGQKDQPPDDTAEKSNELFMIMRSRRIMANENMTQVQQSQSRHAAGGRFSLSQSTEPTTSITTTRKVAPEVSVSRIQKQISLFESAELDKSKDLVNTLHGSMNIPAISTLQLKQDARLRNFENLTQSTSNSNFPFESNTLKRAPNLVNDFTDIHLTQSCINLIKNEDQEQGQEHIQGNNERVVEPSQAEITWQPPHYCLSIFKPTTQSCSTVMTEAITPTSVPSSPGTGALIVEEKLEIELPKGIPKRNCHYKTQSMDADFLFNEFLLVPTTPTSLKSGNIAKNSANIMMDSNSSFPNFNQDK